MAEKKYPSETQDRFIIRFPDDEMRERIARQAAVNGRSMNSEIIARLEASFAELTSPAMAADLARAEAAVESYKRIEAISSATTAALAQYVVTLHERLAPKVRDELNTAIAYRLALALLKKDGAGLADVFGDLFADDLEVVKEMHRLKGEFSGRPGAVILPGERESLPAATPPKSKQPKPSKSPAPHRLKLRPQK